MGRKRMSRALIALLVVTIILGAVAYFHNPGRTKASEQAKTGAQPAVTTAKPAAPAANTTAATAAPAAKSPATRPTQIALGAAASNAIVTRTPADASKNGVPVSAASPLASATPAASVTPPSAAAATNAKTPPAAATVAPPKVAVALSTGAAGKPAAAGNALADGKAQIQSNNLLAGRQILNQALLSGALSAADAQAARELIASANQNLIFSPRRMTNDPFVGSYTVQSGDRPLKIASRYDVTWDFLGRINGISDPRRLRAGATLKTIKGPFHAVVSKSKFTLDLYLGSPGESGSMYACTYRVGLGKHGSTPTGTWMVAPQGKLKNPKWWGTADEPAREADDPLNPLGEFWIGLVGTDGDALDKQGFGIHGTIEPDTIGKEMSHGCIRLTNADVERVYEMLIEGKSTVIVRD